MAIVNCTELPIEHCQGCHDGFDAGVNVPWEETIGKVTYTYCCAAYVKIKLMAELWKEDFNEGS